MIERACTLLVLAGGLALAGADPETFEYRGSGYVDFGIGTCQHNVANTSFGGGGDGFLWRGLALGGDIGYYRFVESGSKAFGIGTVGVGYHFVNPARPRKFDPFVNVGLLGGVFGGGGAGAAASLGGGMNYWFKRHIGLRTEMRFSGMANEEALVMFRIGFSFR